MRTASVYKPDQTIEGVCPNDIIDSCIENRHIGAGEIDAAKLADNAIVAAAITDGVISSAKIATSANGAGVPVVVTYDVTTGAASIKIFNANAPYKFEVLDVIVQPRGASTNGTIKITNGTNDITDAMVCAVDKTMVRATTIDNAYSTIAASGTLEIVCAGDSVTATIGLVTIIGVKRA